MVHESTDRVRSLDYANKSILLHVESDVELRVRLHSVAKEPDMLPWLQTALGPGDVFYDIGANIGAYTLLAAAVHDGTVDVVAFEPSATNYAQLCRNLALNQFGSRIMPLPVALADTCGFVRFGYSDLTAGAALHTVGNMAQRPNTPYVQQVMGMALDDVVSAYCLPEPNAIKIDVDGAEAPLIRGAKKTLRAAGLRSVLIELDEGSDEFPQVHADLLAAGFRVARKHHILGRFYNFVFERS
jgi:FkbM family methyltransferase